MTDLTTFLRARYDERTDLILNHWDSDGKARVASSDSTGPCAR